MTAGVALLCRQAGDGCTGGDRSEVEGYGSRCVFFERLDVSSMVFDGILMGVHVVCLFRSILSPGLPPVSQRTP